MVYPSCVKNGQKTKRLISSLLAIHYYREVSSLNAPTKETKLAVVGIGYMFGAGLCDPPSNVSSNHHIIKADPAASRRKLRAGYASVVALGLAPFIYFIMLDLNLFNQSPCLGLRQTSALRSWLWSGRPRFPSFAARRLSSSVAADPNGHTGRREHSELRHCRIALQSC